MPINCGTPDAPSTGFDYFPAVSILDVCVPAVSQGTDYYTHWALTHFLLDGHHKMHAAADTARPVQLPMLLSVGAGLGSAEQVARIPSLRAAARRDRRPPTSSESSA